MTDSTDRSLSVLLVGKGAPERGGIPSFLETLQRGLENRHTVRFLNLTRDEIPEGGRFSLSNIRKTVGDARRTWHAARHQDVVHIHSALAPTVTIIRAGILGLAARLRGAGVVVHAHGGRIQLWYTSPLRRLVARLALWPAARIVAVSAGAAEMLQRIVGPDRVSLVVNGVDVDRFSSPPGTHEPPRILYVGVLTPRKGLLDLLEASDRLAERGVSHEIRLVGGMPEEGPEAEAAVKAATSERSERVRMMGRFSSDEMPAIYSAADIFCLPSWWEAMPLSLLEAMSAGLAVVATTVGDVNRVVEPGATGLLVEPQNPRALAEALESLLRDEPRRVAFGAEGRRRVRSEFAAEAMLDQISTIYLEVAGL